jgi:hypothetical protein
MAKDARLEFTCTDWGCVIPAHDRPLTVRPRTRSDARQMILVLETLLGHMKHVAGQLPESADITSEPASVNQLVDLRGVHLASRTASLGGR